MMILKLKREIFNKDNTLGSLYIDDKLFCYTCEDKVRDLNNDGDLDDAGETKVYGETAIPKGSYKVIVTMSNRFKKLMPEVLMVKGFAGIRIHAGNTALDSHGCIIVGKTRTANGVGTSAKCFDELMLKLKGQKDIHLIIE